MTTYSDLDGHGHAHDRAHDAPSTRSGTIRVIAIVGFMLAVLGLITAPYAALMTVGSEQSEVNLRMQIPETTGMFIVSLGGTLLSLFLVVASVGCLKLRRWGRAAMIGYSIAAIVLGLVASYFLATMFRSAGGPGAQGSHWGPNGFIAVCGPLFSLPFAAWALWTLTRRHAKRSFTSAGHSGWASANPVARP